MEGIKQSVSFIVILKDIKLIYDFNSIRNSQNDVKLKDCIENLKFYQFKVKIIWANRYKKIYLNPIFCNSEEETTSEKIIQTQFKWKWNDIHEFEYRTKYGNLLHQQFIQFKIKRHRSWIWDIDFGIARFDLQQLSQGNADVTIPISYLDSSSKKYTSWSQFRLNFTCVMNQILPRVHLSFNKLQFEEIRSARNKSVSNNKDIFWFENDEKVQGSLTLFWFDSFQHKFNIHKESNFRYKLIPQWSDDINEDRFKIECSWNHVSWDCQERMVKDLKHSGMLIWIFADNDSNAGGYSKNFARNVCNHFV